jgi:small GTP-binding protein
MRSVHRSVALAARLRGRPGRLRVWAWGQASAAAGRNAMVPAAQSLRFLATKRSDAGAEDELTSSSLDQVPLERFRNFSIIAHVDHGKSTLSDRLLQMTSTIKAGSRAQYMDKLQVEQERGITVKAQTATLFYRGHVLNLIDTPGHVDFSYEVSRSLAACEGVLLIVDASQGVEAQTLANYMLAKKHKLAIVPVVNKIDLPNADIDRVAAQVERLLGCQRDELILVSGKTGAGVLEPIAGEQQGLLDAIVDKIPPPTGGAKIRTQPLQALLFGESKPALPAPPLDIVMYDGEAARPLCRCTGTAAADMRIAAAKCALARLPALCACAGERTLKAGCAQIRHVV